MDAKCTKNLNTFKKNEFGKDRASEGGQRGAASPRVVACTKNGVSTLPRKNPELGTLCIGLYESMHTNQMTN